MKQTTKTTWQAVGAPAGFVRKKLSGIRRHPIWKICWGVFWLMVLWDVYLSLDSTEGNTWSEVMRLASESNPVFPWILGAFLSHLFHHKDNLGPLLEADAAQTVMFILTLLLLAMGWLGLELNGWQIATTAIMGMAAGYLLWPKQRLAEWHW